MRLPIRLLVPAAALAALAAAPAPAQAEQWRAIAIDDKTAHGMGVAYADTDTIARTGDEIAFDYQIRFSSPPERFDRLAGRMRIHCSQRLWGSQGSAHYQGGRRGAEFPAREMGPVRPDTNGAVILETMCSGRFLSGPVDPAVHSRGVFAGR